MSDERTEDTQPQVADIAEPAWKLLSVLVPYAWKIPVRMRAAGTGGSVSAYVRDLVEKDLKEAGAIDD